MVKKKSEAGGGIWGAGVGVGLIETVRCGLTEMRELAVCLTAWKVLWRTCPDPCSAVGQWFSFFNEHHNHLGSL